MKKTNPGFFIMIFAIIWSLVVFAVYNSYDSSKYQTILKEGIETTAIVNISKTTTDSPTIFMDKEYYSVYYYFEDDNGNTHMGETSDSYRHSEVEKIVDDGTILIKYHPTTFESVQADYTKSNDIEYKAMILFFSIFLVVAIILWIVTIVAITKNNKRPKNDQLEFNGQQYTATVVGIGTNITQNGIQRYYIDYTWTDQSGKQYSNRTPSDYSYEHARLMEQTGQIKIIAKGKNSYIIENGIVSAYQKTIVTPQKEVIETSKKNCQYCGAPLHHNKDKCPNCGAKTK